MTCSRQMYRGLSPRGRGNPVASPSASSPPGSIPAWAGEPPPLGYSKAAAAVYPRVGGGTAIVPTARTAREGLSPRGRGNREHTADRKIQYRSIPAWAGEPINDEEVIGIIRVYPRVGGGTWMRPSQADSLFGLSPRGRGNQWVKPQALAHTRSIPAWAGEPPLDDYFLRSYAVYPRVGGGTRAWMIPAPPVLGLSPRGRGNLLAGGQRHADSGSIPAWAGEPLSACGVPECFPVYPRVGGGTPTVWRLRG